jgi:hypothetical protein
MSHSRGQYGKGLGVVKQVFQSQFPRARQLTPAIGNSPSMQENQLGLLPATRGRNIGKSPEYSFFAPRIPSNKCLTLQPSSECAVTLPQRAGVDPGWVYLQTLCYTPKQGCEVLVLSIQLVNMAYPRQNPYSHADFSLISVVWGG